MYQVSKFFMVLILSMSSSYGFANCCICQVGSSPKKEIPLFKFGCKAWLAKKLCLMGKTISIDDSVEKHIPKSCKGKKLKLGYVGHWNSSEETVEFLSDILDTLTEKKLSLDYHNTACLGMDEPKLVADFLKKSRRSLGDRHISVKANQVISSGMWDPFLIGKNNLYAEVSTLRTDRDLIEFPKCREFVDKKCTGAILTAFGLGPGNIGFCTERNGEKVLIKCMKGATVYDEVYNDYSVKQKKVILVQKRPRKATVWKKVLVKKSDFKIKESIRLTSKYDYTGGFLGDLEILYSFNSSKYKRVKADIAKDGFSGFTVVEKDNKLIYRHKKHPELKAVFYVSDDKMKQNKEMKFKNILKEFNSNKTKKKFRYTIRNRKLSFYESLTEKEYKKIQKEFKKMSVKDLQNLVFESNF